MENTMPVDKRLSLPCYLLVWFDWLNLNLTEMFWRWKCLLIPSREVAWFCKSNFKAKPSWCVIITICPTGPMEITKWVKRLFDRKSSSRGYLWRNVLNLSIGWVDELELWLADRRDRKGNSFHRRGRRALGLSSLFICKFINAIEIEFKNIFEASYSRDRIFGEDLLQIILICLLGNYLNKSIYPKKIKWGFAVQNEH